jgi:hypothetical protein
MTVDRRGVLGLLGASMALPARAADADLPLAEILARHSQAVGSEAAQARVHSKAVDLQIIEKGSVVEAHYRADKSPSFRIDIYDKGRHVFCEGLDAKGPWIWPGDAPAARQGVPEAKMSGLTGIQFNLYGLKQFPALGNRITPDGREEIEGVNYHVLRVALKDAYDTFLYLDPATFLIARRRDFRPNHPDLNPAKESLETQFSDYRRVDGLMNAFLQHQVDLSSGRINQVQVVERMEYDPAGPVKDRGAKAQ